MNRCLTKPLLCDKLTPEELPHVKFPLLLTPKFDGLRCLKLRGCALTRSFKLVRNRHVQEQLAKLPDGCDGELIVFGGDFTDSQSGVCSYGGKPNFLYCVFDFAPDGPLMELPYRERAKLSAVPDLPFVRRVEPWLAESSDDLLRYEELALAAGYEGVIARDLDAEYVCGRSSAAMKFKRVETSEARVIGFTEAHANVNPMVRGAFGQAKRPGGWRDGDGREPKGTLGSFLVRDVSTGVEFGIGTGKGLTKQLRQRVWDDRSAYLGRLLRYAHQPSAGYVAPRFPSFQCFLEEGGL